VITTATAAPVTYHYSVQSGNSHTSPQRLGLNSGHISLHEQEGKGEGGKKKKKKEKKKEKKGKDT